MHARIITGTFSHSIDPKQALIAACRPDWLEEMLLSGGLRYLDGVTLHSYPANGASSHLVDVLSQPSWIDYPIHINHLHLQVPRVYVCVHVCIYTCVHLKLLFARCMYIYIFIFARCMFYIYAP